MKQPRIPKPSTGDLITPPSDYTQAILQVMSDFGGSTYYEEVLQKVGKIMKDRLTQKDFEMQFLDYRKEKTPIWYNNAYEKGEQLLHRKLLKKGVRRGEWEISEIGKIELQKLNE